MMIISLFMIELSGFVGDNAFRLNIIQMDKCVGSPRDHGFVW
jgi:hypothetical protein